MKPLSRTFPLLREMEIESLATLVESRDCPAETVVLQEGERARGLFIVQTGRVRVEKAHMGVPVPVAELGEGELFGEMSFVESSAASATVVAETDCRIGELSVGHVSRLLARNPEMSARLYHSLALLLSRRLRRTTQSVMPGSVLL